MISSNDVDFHWLSPKASCQPFEAEGPWLPEPILNSNANIFERLDDRVGKISMFIS
jgi:hypothetical protein